mgnify:FL=1
MAYRNLYSPLSQFVDPGSTEISETLRERYLLNFQKQDAISESMAQLPVASFSNDQAIYKDLYQNTRGKIDELAQRGDYENMFIPVQTLAQQYREAATPLAKNYELYQTDKEAKEKLLEEGKITMSDYQGWLKKSRLSQQGGDYVPYAGLELDERGKAKIESYYGGTPIAQYVDVQQEILDALNDIPEIKEGGYTVKGYQTGPDGLVYAVEDQQQTIEYIPQETVAAVTQNILNRPDVAAYMNQSADFATMDMDEPTLNMIISKQITDMEDADEAQGAAQLRQILNSGSPGMKRQAARAIAYNKDYSNYVGTALATRQPSAYGGSHKISYDKALNERLQEDNAQSGSYTVVTPGGELMNVSTNIVDSTGEVTASSVNDNITRLQTANTSTVQAAVQVLPVLQDIITSRNPVPLEERFAMPDAVNNIANEIIALNPDLDRGIVVQQLQQVKSTIDYNNAEMEASRMLLRKSYGDWGENFTANVLSDVATQEMEVVGGMADYYNTVDLNQNYVYDEETNTVIVKNEEPTEGSREAAKIVILARMLQNVDSMDSVFRNSNVDKMSSMGTIVSQMFGVGEEEAAELIALAKDVSINREQQATRQSPYGMGAPQVSGMGDPETYTTTIVDTATQLGQNANTVLMQNIGAGKNTSDEFLSSKKSVNYRMGVSSTALGDTDGKLSKAVNDELKGVNMNTYANVSIVRDSTMGEEVKTVAQALGDGLNAAEIAGVKFTQILTPAGMKAAVVLDLKKVSGADKNIALPTSTITMLYDDVIQSFDPAFASQIENTYNSPGGMLINNALSLMLNIPGAYSPEEGVRMTDNINGRNFEITVFPTIRPLQDEETDIVAGVGRVKIKASGNGLDTVEQEMSVNEFIQYYNGVKSIANNT